MKLKYAVLFAIVGSVILVILSLISGYMNIKYATPAELRMNIMPNIGQFIGRLALLIFFIVFYKSNKPIL
jgi:xanthine/uracil/vitamin C permease (AzgA family)